MTKVFSLGELASFVDGELIGDRNETVTAPAEISKAQKGNISFLVSQKYRKFLKDCKATCIVVEKGFTETEKERISELEVKNFIEVDNPTLAMIKILSLWEYKVRFPDGHNLSYISPDAKVGEGVVVFPFVYVGSGAEIGNGSILMPGVFIGDGAKIGKGVFLFPNVVVYPYCEIGDNSIIHAGAVIGSDGFGYVSYFGEIVKVPQVGAVKIGRSVEIGANSCVDRATMGYTYIEDDVKVDNLVQIAHNVRIGRGTRIAALSGIAGSSTIGEYCIFGGQVGISDHVNVGDFAMVGARSAIMSDTEGGKVLMGEPAMERTKFLKTHALYLKLPEIYERLKELESKLKK